MIAAVKTTLPDDPSEASSGVARRGWSLVVVHHRDRRRHGRRLLMAADSTSQLGRGSTQFGKGALDDDRISRKHVELTCSAAGELRLRDFDSRNGTYLNGVRVDEAPVGDGDVLGLGGRLMVFRHAPPLAGLGKHADAPVGVSHIFREALSRIERVIDRSTPLLLTGPSGVGKTTLAQWFHHRTASGGPLRTVHCAALGEPDLLSAQLGDATNVAAALDGGTLLLEGIDQTPPKAQPVIIALLEHFAGRSDNGPRVVSTSLTAPGGDGWNSDVARRAARWVVRVPRLEERAEDIALLADEFVERFGGPTLRLDARYALSLIRREWEGNVHELEVEVEASVIATEGNIVKAAPTHTAGDLAWMAEATAAWFEPPGQERVSLGERPTLRRVLAALIEAQARQPGTALSVSQLLNAGWPGEGPSADSGANRVYVALTTLRKLGLKEIITRNKAGYLLAQVPQLI